MKNTKSLSLSDSLSASSSFVGAVSETNGKSAILRPVESSIYNAICAELVTQGVIDSNEHSTAKIKKFASSVSQLACDIEFIDDLSERVGIPLGNESEDEFVARAKSMMRYLLREKLGE